MRGTNNNYFKLTKDTMTNVKLVLGNGFDLACGLNSSYNNFFKHSDYLYKKIEKWFNGEEVILDNEISTWDLVFVSLKQLSNNNLYNCDIVEWKDVETIMKKVLGPFNEEQENFIISFPEIKKAFESDDCSKLNNSSKLILTFIKNRIGNKNYYDFLLEELTLFEKRFSDYIYDEMQKGKYEENVKKMLNDSGLLKIDEKELKSIDTFNYTMPNYFMKIENPSSKERYRNVRVRHINGEINSAIFGIDSQGIDLCDDRYKFTKTHRKMVRLIDGGREGHKRSYKNVVVYGHSLSEADYSYFFSIMDNLKLYDYGVYGQRFIVAFSDYNENARKRIVEATLKMLDAYDKWKNPHSNRHGLIDVLLASDRIGFTRVDLDLLKL